MLDLIPHQLHLTRPQITKMMKGQGINIPHSQMGSDKGEVVVLLHPHNAKKMLTAYKKGKGMRLILSPEEMGASEIHGRGIGRAFKKLGRQISKGAKKLGKDIMQDVINPAGDALSSKQAMEVYKTIGKHALEQGLPIATTLGSMALGDPTGMSGAALGNVASQYASSQYSKHTGAGLYGGAVFKDMRHRPSMPDETQDARRKYMALIRSMKGMSAEEKEKVKGSGLFKMLSKLGYKKKSVIKGLKDVGKNVVKHGSARIGDAIGAYTGNPLAGEMIGEALNRAGEKGLDSIKPSKHGITLDKGEAIASLKKDMRDLGKVELQRLVAENVPPEYQGVAQQVIAGVPIADVVGDEMKRRQMYGSGRPRGRPRKHIVGLGAAQSKAYQQALKANYSGLTLSTMSGDNKPIGEFSVNPMVMPSSDEMTLSPYQSTTAPAMNPFIPKFYTQMGGTQSGYGGRGLF